MSKSNGEKKDPAPWLRPHQWKPGQSGNPAGRKKGQVALMTRVRQELEKTLEDGTQVADKLVKVLLEASLADPAKMWPFLREFICRDEGVLKSEIRLTTESTVEDFYSAIDRMKSTVPRSHDDEESAS